jgi:hypothetical protein
MSDSKSLLALTSEACVLEQKIIAVAENNAGEFDPDLEFFLAEIEHNLEVKTDSYKCVIDRLEAGIKQLDERADEFYRASKAMHNIVERMKFNIKQAMCMRNLTEIKGKSYRFKLANAQPRLIITNSECLPDEYIRQTVVTETNKEKLKEDLKLGKTITGAALEPAYSLRAYINKETKK